MTQQNPEDVLEVCDKLDLDVPEERRIALFSLNDYFGIIFGEVGEKLDFRTSDYGGSLRHQWDKASSRLGEVDSVDIPDEYNQTLNTIAGLRNDYAHNFRDCPPQEPIESAIETAPEWNDWIRAAAEEYEAYQESLTATEALVQVGERILDDNLDNPMNYSGGGFLRRAKDLSDRAGDLRERLHEFEDNEEVTKELVETISEVMEWENETTQLRNEFERWEKEEEERLETIDRAENTYNFLVLEEVDELDEIVIGKHEPAEPDTVYRLTVSNSPISQEEMEYLRNLNVDDEVRLWMGANMYRNNRGYFDEDPIIKEVVDLED